MEACARAGTHYADLTGEVLFVREAIDRCDALARESAPGSCTSTGPLDLAVLLLHERRRRTTWAASDVQLVATFRGGLSGAARSTRSASSSTRCGTTPPPGASPPIPSR